MIEGNTGKVGIVFGPEGKGLLNDELRDCEILVTIPTWEGYPIMNLSHAVAVICYSWFINSESDENYEGLRILSPGLRKRFREEVARLAQAIYGEWPRGEGQRGWGRAVPATRHG